MGAVGTTTRGSGRNLVTVTFAVTAGLLLSAAAAYACAPQAKMELKNEDATPGGTVDGSGKGFNGTPAAGEVEVHFNATEGNVVWQGTPSPTGEVSFSFEVPEDVEPGYYTIVATQYEASGRRVPGTPARASLQVLTTETAEPPAAALPSKKESSTTTEARRPERSGRVTGRPAALTVPSTSVPVADVSRPVASAQSTRKTAQARPEAAARTQISRGPAPAGERRTVVAPDIQGAESRTPVMLALGLVITGVALSVAASASIMAGRRSKKAAVAGRGAGQSD